MNCSMYENELEFYKNMLNCDYDTMELPFNNRNLLSYQRQNQNETKISKLLDKNIYKKIKEFTHKYEISETALFYTIYGFVLSKYSKNDLIYSSIICSNKNNSFTDDLIGMFVCTQLLLLNYSRQDLSFIEIINENMNILMNVYSNQDTSMADLVEKLKLKKMNNNFIFQPNMMFDLKDIFKNTDILLIGDNNYKFEEFKLKNDEYENISKFDFTFGISENQDSYILTVEFNNNLYDENMIKSIVNSYFEVFQNMEYFDHKIKDIEYISKEEKEKIMNQFNSNICEIYNDKVYHVEFNKVAKKNSNLCAIICNDIEMTYKELDEKSNSLIHWLIRRRVHRGDIIPVITERSLYYVLASLAIMKSGAAFLPVDPEFPEERIKYMIEEANAEIIFKECISKVKVLIFGGESIKLDILQTIIKYTDASIYNAYGSTETTMMSTMKKFNNNQIMEGRLNHITIGKPVCNYEIYILDEFFKVVPIGITGEMYIAGCGVGKGYLNKEKLTNEKFIECPFNNENGKKKKMYKSGDLGRWLENGEIEYLGRMDFQVKIHGQRIELSEIENIIKEIKSIKYCAIIDKVKENGDKYLVGYYISEGSISGKEIRNYLKQKLPVYMIPNYFIKIETIPMTNNGKLDRRAFSEPNINDILKEDYVPPETEVEKFLCRNYSELFNINKKEVGKQSDFYELGGDSINSIHVSSIIEKKFTIKVSIKEILKKYILSKLSNYIEECIRNAKKGKRNSGIIEKRKIKEFPLTSQQLGVYLDCAKHPNNTIYNITTTIKLNNNIDKEKLKASFEKIFRKHEIFRSKYIEKEINGKTEIYGVIDENCTLRFEEYSYSNVNAFMKPFNLSQGPLFRVGFIGNEILMIDMHHIIADGSSIAIIAKELINYYSGMEDSTSSLEIQYTD